MKYKHLSRGYLGKINNNLTLNAKFYSLLDNDTLQKSDQIVEEIILFPQRVPKSGFFDELAKLETIHYKMGFNAKLYDIKKCLKNSCNNLNNNPNVEAIRAYINWANRCLRYGCFEDVMESTYSLNSKQPYNLEIQLIKEAANIERKLSNDFPLNIDKYLTLTTNYLNSQLISDREKISLLNQLIVTFYRHGTDHTQSNVVYDYAKILLSLLEQFEKNLLLNQLYCSVGYRGLAMVIDFGEEMQTQFLDHAECIAINMQATDKRNEVIVMENQYTLFQTLAKWHKQHDGLSKSLFYLEKMIQLDPYDSTGYSEIGFHYIGAEKYEEAAYAFRKAIELGPPGTAMNTYYYAKCLEKLEKYNEAIDCLYQAAEFDNQGISPWLDLLDYYIAQKQLVKAREIAKHIFHTTILCEQLEHDELIKLQNMLN